jgi:CubicO group peptidase (beta-lactamase class C family)
VENNLIAPLYLEGDSTWTIEARMKHYGVPGVSIAVINDYKIEWVKTYGVMDKETQEPVTPQTLFQAGSISKPVAAYGALKLAEQGKINLDENINTYLRSWKLPDNEFTKEKKVALKHLLSHTGGVTVHGFLGYSPDLPVPTLLQVLDGTPPANSPPIRVDKAPEKSFRYAGGGYCIMQQALIDIENKPFPQIMQETVLQPLGMSNSTYEQPLPEAKLKMAATGYVPDGSMTKGKRHTYPEMAAAGLWTTSEDLARFAIDIQQALQGKSTNVLSQAMATKMLTPFVEEFIGLGIFIDRKKDDLYFQHGGWDEGFSSQLVAHKDKGYGVVILTNSNHPDFINELVRSVAHTYNWSNYVPVYKRQKTDTTRFAEIEGRYYNGRDGLITIHHEKDHLYFKYLRGEPVELLQVSDSTYITYRYSTPIQFKVNPADHQLNLIMLDNSGKPAEYIHSLKKDDTKVPYEYLLAGDFDKAWKGYQEIKATAPTDPAINEENINQGGYDLLQSGKTKLAQQVFKINMLLHPNSSNAYDSYAEACYKNGDTKEAIANYKKSLSLNPKNANATNMLEKIEKEKSKK